MPPMPSGGKRLEAGQVRLAVTVNIKNNRKGQYEGKDL
jgi:hypothetical protein